MNTMTVDSTNTPLTNRSPNGIQRKLTTTNLNGFQSTFAIWANQEPQMEKHLGPLHEANPVYAASGDTRAAS
ncbi:Hypothetical predicted protein [Pelobates cultripes]|uniref:Uncharacterized protein n=1 Tax=Pelobates cultripes TaxID=61616 RepID=A0AAD1SPZ2_PELCU|nr:Hypothetical predicted protein [Pelobates cultripes]